MNDRQQIVIDGRPLLRARDLSGARVGRRRLARRPRGGRAGRPLRGRTPGRRGERADDHADRTLTYWPTMWPTLRPTTARPSRSAATLSGLSTSAASRAGPRGRSKACTRTGRRTASGSPSRSPTRLSSTVSSAARRRCAGTWSRGSSPGPRLTAASRLGCELRLPPDSDRGRGPGSGRGVPTWANSGQGSLMWRGRHPLPRTGQGHTGEISRE